MIDCVKTVIRHSLTGIEGVAEHPATQNLYSELVRRGRDNLLNRKIRVNIVFPHLGFSQSGNAFLGFEEAVDGTRKYYHEFVELATSAPKQITKHLRTQMDAFVDMNELLQQARTNCGIPNKDKCSKKEEVIPDKAEECQDAEQWSSTSETRFSWSDKNKKVLIMQNGTKSVSKRAPSQDLEYYVEILPIV